MSVSVPQAAGLAPTTTLPDWLPASQPASLPACLPQRPAHPSCAPHTLCSLEGRVADCMRQRLDPKTPKKSCNYPASLERVT